MSKSKGKVKWQYAQSRADTFINSSFGTWESCTPGNIVTRVQAGRPANHGCIPGRGTNISPQYEERKTNKMQQLDVYY